MKKEEYYYRLEKAIEFIETNINKNFLLSDLSENVFSSLSHFHRIFYFMTGLTIKEYIRARRLSNAGIELVSGQRKVLDIALDAQFESPESFNRAFKNMFKLSPREFRRLKPEFQVMRKMEFDDTCELKMPDNLILSFVYLPQQLVKGLKTRTSLENRRQAKEIPCFAEKVIRENLLAKMQGCIDNQKIYGVYSDMSDEEDFDYTIGLLVEASSNSNAEYSGHLLPAAEYARFSVEGDSSQLEAAWKYIYGSWMPNSGRSRQRGLDFEIYSPDKTNIYIPMHPSK